MKENEIGAFIAKAVAGAVIGFVITAALTNFLHPVSHAPVEIGTVTGAGAGVTVFNPKFFALTFGVIGFLLAIFIVMALLVLLIILLLSPIGM